MLYLLKLITSTKHPIYGYREKKEVVEKDLWVDIWFYLVNDTFSVKPTFICCIWCSLVSLCSFVSETQAVRDPFSVLLCQYFLCFLWLIPASCCVSHILVSVYLDWHGQRSWNWNVFRKLVEGLSWAAEERLLAADSQSIVLSVHHFTLAALKSWKEQTWKWS